MKLLVKGVAATHCAGHKGQEVPSETLELAKLLQNTNSCTTFCLETFYKCPREPVFWTSWELASRVAMEPIWEGRTSFAVQMGRGTHSN